jgi:hypothetical protein
MYHQGIVVYETTLPKPGIYQFDIMAHDHALLFVDGVLAASVARTRL